MPVCQYQESIKFHQETIFTPTVVIVGDGDAAHKIYLKKPTNGVTKWQTVATLSWEIHRNGARDTQALGITQIPLCHPHASPQLQRRVSL